MQQDSRTLIGFIVIGLLLTIWIWWAFPPVRVTQTPPAADTTHAAAPAPVRTDTVPAISDSARGVNTYGTLFARFARGTERRTIVHTSLYTAELSSRGGGLARMDLAHYRTWNGYPVALIDPDHGAELNLLFASSEGKLISTGDLYFASQAPPEVSAAGDSTALTYTLAIDSTRRIVKRLVFHDGTYRIDASFVFEHCEDVIGNYHYQVTWDHALPFAEENSIDECSSAEAAAYQNGELETVDADKFDQQFKKEPSGSTQWVAARNKYFVAALIAPQAADGAYLAGTRIGLPDNGARESYDIALQFPYHKTAVETARVTVYAGPLDFRLVRGLNVDLEKFMSFGWALIVRPIGVYFMLPIFNFLHSFIPNYGIVIVVFSLLIKLLLTPLSLGQMKSAKKMQLLQPLMAEMREKLKEDPARMNQEVMKLYSTYGINPMGGCLPMLMQMPILYAMWALLRNAIELRQTSFALWITDLSVPDVIVRLPFRLPLLGVDALSGLAVLMGIAIFLQQKLTISDPRQKAMVYVMPVLLALMFAGLPSGLNLYYFMFNLLSISQQLYFNRKHKEIKLVPVERKAGAPGKGGRMTFTQRVLEAQHQAQKRQGSGGRKGRR